MIVDILAGLLNQKSLIKVVKRLETIDEKLMKDNITINYRRLQKITTFIVFLVIGCECTNVFLNYLFFLDTSSLQSLWFLITIIPITTNTIARIWFFILVFSIRERFKAINEFLIKTKESIVDNKRKFISTGITDDTIDGNSAHLGYLEEEIFNRHRQGVGFNKWNKVHITTGFKPKSIVYFYFRMQFDLWVKFYFQMI